MESQIESHQLCFNSRISLDEARIFAIIYIIALTIFFSSLLLFIHYLRSNIILRERCCNILILQTITTYGYLIVYPMSFLFSDDQTYDDISYLAIIFFIALFKYIPILCYLMRSFRFYYAFNDTHEFFQLKRKTLIPLLIIILATIGILDTLTEFDKNIFYEAQQNSATQIPRMIFVYLSQLILIIAIFLMRKVNGFLQFDYWTAFSAEVISYFIKVYLRNGRDFTDCSLGHKIPLYYYMDCLKLVIMLICSSIVPLFFKHKAVGDLPFEMECSNFRFFLSQTQFIQLFYDYLSYFEKTKVHYQLEENQITQTLLKINNNNFTTILDNDHLKCPFKPSLPKCLIAYINLTLWLEVQSMSQTECLSQLQQETVQFLSDLISELSIIKSTFQQQKQPLNSQTDVLANENKIDISKSQNFASINLDNIETIWLLKNILFEILKEIYETQFKLTNSYQTILKDCINNRIIWLRLGKMGLTGNNQ